MRTKVGFYRVTEDDDKREIARLEQVNEQLEGSLERCRELLQEYRSKLAANTNTAESPSEDNQRERSG